MKTSAIQIILHPGIKQTEILEAPSGYEFTGEYRSPKSGEPFLDSRNEATAIYAEVSASRYFILRPIETAKERRAKRLLEAISSWARCAGPLKPFGEEQFAEQIERIFAEEKD